MNAGRHAGAVDRHGHLKASARPVTESLLSSTERAESQNLLEGLVTERTPKYVECPFNYAGNARVASLSAALRTDEIAYVGAGGITHLYAGEISD